MCKTGDMEESQRRDEVIKNVDALKRMLADDGFFDNIELLRKTMFFLFYQNAIHSIGRTPNDRVFSDGDLNRFFVMQFNKINRGEIQRCIDAIQKNEKTHAEIIKRQKEDKESEENLKDIIGGGKKI